MTKVLGSQFDDTVAIMAAVLKACPNNVENRGKTGQIVCPALNCPQVGGLVAYRREQKKGHMRFACDCGRCKGME